MRYVAASVVTDRQTDRQTTDRTTTVPLAHAPRVNKDPYHRLFGCNKHYIKQYRIAGNFGKWRNGSHSVLAESKFGDLNG